MFLLYPIIITFGILKFYSETYSPHVGGIEGGKGGGGGGSGVCFSVKICSIDYPLFSHLKHISNSQPIIVFDKALISHGSEIFEFIFKSLNNVAQSFS